MSDEYQPKPGKKVKGKTMRSEGDRVFRRNLWLGLIIMALLSPLGLLLPKFFKAEETWGEWVPERLQGLLGYVPQGLRRTAALWKAPLTDYSANGDHPSLLFQIAWYGLSAFLGLILIVLVIYVFMRYVARHDN
jgi:cobalt/nickel transport protein